MKTIPLTQGHVALVDDGDFGRVSQYKWCLHRGRGRAFYAKTRIRGPGKQPYVTLHRFILGLTDPRRQADHRNGNGLDNRRDNLRVCNNSENHQGHLTKPAGCSSCFRGVHWHTRARKWQARIHYDGKTHSLGLFHSADEAARTRDVAARIRFGEFAQLNFPNLQEAA